jgi:magnesium and cobalt transporter
MTEGSTNGQAHSWLGRLVRIFSSTPATRDDITEILRSAYDDKVIDNEALEIMEGALSVADQQVREIMVPRSRMTVIPESADIEEILTLVTDSKHSRFPVIGDSIDDIKGILLAKELLPLLLEDKEDLAITDVIRPANIIPESKRLNVLLKEFREQRYHMAIVMDEYASVAGLVTIEDILEEIVGEIEDETDLEEQNPIQRQKDGSHSLPALTTIEDFNEFFNTGFNEDEFNTIGGLVTQAFGHLPQVGEEVTLGEYAFTVISGDDRQIHQLALKCREAEANEQ